MSDIRFRRGYKAIYIIESGQTLTSCALSAHSPSVSISNSLLEEVAAENSFAFIGRRSAGKPDCRVRVTPSYVLDCLCRHYEELILGCGHAPAAMKVDSTVVGLEQYQSMVNRRLLWTIQHLRTWRAQPTDVVKRESLAGHAEQLKQETSFRRRCASGRASSGTSRAAMQPMPRTCPTCCIPANFTANCPKPNSIRLSQAKRQKAVEAFIIDLTTRAPNFEIYQ